VVAETGTHADAHAHESRSTMRIWLNHAAPEEVQILSPRSAFYLQIQSFQTATIRLEARPRAIGRSRAPAAPARSSRRRRSGGAARRQVYSRVSHAGAARSRTLPWCPRPRIRIASFGEWYPRTPARGDWPSKGGGLVGGSLVCVVLIQAGEVVGEAAADGHLPWETGEERGYGELLQET
jgi:hypothetical protein